MTRTIKILMIAALFSVGSCSDDFLSPDPISAVSGEEYYSNDQEIETAVIALYDGLQGINDTSSDSNHSTQIEYQLTEMRSDNTRSKAQEGESAQFESFSVEATNGIVYDYYRSLYNVIFRANIVLENLENASAEAALGFEGEAKFVRAYSYFQLVRLYGPIPLVDRVIGVNDKEIQFTRRDVADIYQLIISDLTVAVANLDESGQRFRASKSAAEALLAKVYLTTGDYSNAQALCESVMSKGYVLMENFKDVFYIERNPEIIFAIEYKADDTNDSQNFSAEWLNAVGRSSGLNYVTPEARAALDEFGGNRTLYSYRQDQAQPTEYQVVKYLPNGDEALGIDPTSSNPTLAGNDWIVLRYSDVLLMHVESILAGAESTSSSNAIASYQKVRERAGIMDPVTTITKDDLLLERRVELAFENQRFFDLVRFGVAVEVFTEFAADNGYTFSATDLLLPLPQAEINLSNGLLEQNPGY